MKKELLLSLLISVSITSLAYSKEINKEELLCQRVINKLLKSPSSYKIISTFSSNRDGKLKVSVEFDAQNGFGALIRDTGVCVYAFKIPANSTSSSEYPIESIYFIENNREIPDIDVKLEQLTALVDIDVETKLNAQSKATKKSNKH